MVFERYIPPRSLTSAPKATIRPTGLISFDADAVTSFNLKDATHLVLYFDPKRKLIGVKDVNDGGVDGATPVTRRRRSLSVKCPEFFNTYGLIITESRRYDVKRDNRAGMMTIDVSDVRRRRGRRPKSVVA
jgi:hypothetical protein